MNAFAQQCISLRKRDYSLLDIVRITGRPKASVYPYIKNIPLSEKKLEAIRKKNNAHLQKVAASRRGKSGRNFKKFSAWTENMALLVSHLTFDGEISRSTCSYNNRNRTLLQRVEQLMKEIYIFEPNRYENKLTGVHRISYHNVALASYLKEKSKKLLEEAPRLASGPKREILRAFFDDEGCMDFRPLRNLRQIRGYQKDTRVLHTISSLLSDFGIKSSVQKPNEVVISRKENLLKFKKEINFSPGVFINGNRTNSSWKKHLEKRELLNMAIASFKK